MVQVLLHPFDPAADRCLADPRLAPAVGGGNYFEWLPGIIASAVPHADLADRHALLGAPKTPDGLRNPLFQPVHYLAMEGQSELKRLRRVCCVLYLVRGLDRCGNCPLVTP
ncbi:MAG TPA: hypothetical protein VGC62_07190 [Pseudomonas sp.]|uniref:(2Fe-2S)-binding protein n=1 Tax=Pseudomonas sp. TaxID=306 RepID=UPI002ED8E5EF